MGNNLSEFQEGAEMVIGIKDLDVVQQMQQNHGGWSDNMKECLTGPCKLIQAIGADVLVKGPSGALYRLNPEILTRYVADELIPGMEVLMIDNEEEVRKLQVGHGGWADGMKDLLGKSVEIVQKFPDGDYKIKAEGRTWTVSASCFRTEKSDGKKKLTKGDKVKFGNSKMDIISYQENHGGWSDMMTLILGEEVEVVEVLEDGDCYVSKYGMKWMVNQRCFQTEKKDNGRLKTTLCKGDSVKISDNLKVAKELQTHHGGWVSAMKLVLGKVGTVEMILPTEDVKVNVNGLSFVFNSELLTKIERGADARSVHVFNVGDKVKVLKDRSKVKKLQKNHGEWIESMRLILGEKGKVKSIFPDGDLRVKIMGNIITINPLCVKKVDDENDSDSDVPDFMRMMSQMAKMFNDDDTDSSKDSDKEETAKELPNELSFEHMKLFAALKSGNLEETTVLINQLGPNISVQKIYPLTVAVSEGHEHLVQLLLDKGANIAAKDNDGDTALHIAVEKNRVEICKLLVDKGANVNEKNKVEMTALMMAASSGHLDILRYLVKAPKVDFDEMNKDKDTALHLAIQKSRLDSVEILLEAGADMMLVNEKQFSSFHLAALRGNEKILEVFLKKAGPVIVDFQKEDKFAALHIAALNNHPGCMKLLIKYNADINIRNGKLQTPLHIAVSQRYFECVKILVENKAEINLKDESGDTPIHDGVRAYSMEKMKSMGALFGMPDMLRLIGGAQRGTDAPEDIVLYLARNGARFDIKNNNGNTVITACDDPTLRGKLISIKEGKEPQKVFSTLKPEENVPDSQSELNQLKLKVKALEEENICMICCDRKINSTFQCGHVSCDVCANNLYECHMCRKPISNIIKIFR